MRKAFFPPGPIGFQVYGIGFEQGVPFIHALVAMGKIPKVQYQECRLIFKAEMNGWFCADHQLDEEENEMIKQVWSEECRKKGVPNESP